MANLIALQMVSVPDTSSNLDCLENELAQLHIEEPTLVVLPECFASFGGSDRSQLEIAEDFGKGKIQNRLLQLAKSYKVWLVAGTIPIKYRDPERFSATCLVINDQGKIQTHYQKIHMFDVRINDATGAYLESKFTYPGGNVVTLDSPFGKLGVAVCYDLRFPGLFQAMGEIDVLALPSAFTQRTGEAHWHPLLQARSIEKQCYVIAANQGGLHKNGRATYGHSCIYSPWGKQLCEISNGQGLVSTDLDTELINDIRTRMPVSQQNRFRSEFV